MPQDSAKFVRAVDKVMQGKGIYTGVKSLAADTAVKGIGSFFRDRREHGLRTALSDRFSLNAWAKWNRAASRREKLVRGLGVYAPLAVALGTSVGAIAVIAATGGVGAIPIGLLTAAGVGLTTSGAMKGIADRVFSNTVDKVRSQQRFARIRGQMARSLPGWQQSLASFADGRRAQVFSRPMPAMTWI
jgi:hypothetical protein